MEKQMTTKAEKGLQAYQPALDLLNQAPTLQQDHLRLSKIKIHQATTTGRQGMLGELFSVPELTVLAKPGEKIVFYPITYKLSWYHNKKSPSDPKPVPIGITPWKARNQFEWKTTEADGTIKQNFETVTFFAILESDLLKGIVTPTQIVFSSTSFTSAGLPLMNKYDELKRHKVEPWLMKFSLFSEQSKKGAWQLFKVEPVADAKGHVRTEDKNHAGLRQWASTLLELQKKGDLETTADDIADSVVEEKPLNDADLQF